MRVLLGRDAGAGGGLVRGDRTGSAPSRRGRRRRVSIRRLRRLLDQHASGTRQCMLIEQPGERPRSMLIE